MAGNLAWMACCVSTSRVDHAKHELAVLVVPEDGAKARRLLPRLAFLQTTVREVNLPWIFGLSSAGARPELNATTEQFRTAQVNGQRVIAAAIAVEKEFEKIINARVAGEPGIVNSYFSEHILGAEWFTFSTKRKLVLEIFGEFDHLKGKDKSEVETILSKVMKLRNHFAHGHFVSKNGDVFISYFDGVRTEEILSEQFWGMVETTFNRAIELLVKGQKSMGITPGWGNAG